MVIVTVENQYGAIVFCKTFEDSPNGIEKAEKTFCQKVASLGAMDFDECLENGYFQLPYAIVKIFHEIECPDYIETLLIDSPGKLTPSMLEDYLKISSDSTA